MDCSHIMNSNILLTCCLLAAFALTGFSQAPVADFSDEEFTDLPPAKPGQCFVRTKLPAVYETVKQRVLVQDASEVVEIVPAVYTQVVRNVVVKDGYTQYNLIEASFEEREVLVEIKPPSKKLVHTPPRYEEIDETVVVKPARQEWKRGVGLRGEVGEKDSDMICLVTIPAETKTVKRRIMVTPAKTEEMDVPAETILVKRMVKLKPARVESIEIPPEMEQRMVKVLVEPTKRVATPVEKKYALVDRQVLVTPERMGWVRVLCDTNLKAPIIMDIQDALKANGYDAGEKRGVFTKGLDAAIKKYAEENSLPNGITYDLLKSLEVKAPEDR